MSQNNFGYCCINNTLRDSEGVYTNRTMRQKTFLSKGLGYTSELAETNTHNLYRILEWNHDNNFKMFRITSDLFPWASEYHWEELPGADTIYDNLQRAGNFALSVGQRITFHPGPFNCLASPKEDVVDNCVKDLSIHGIQMDLLNQPRNHQAVLNIHIGASYGDRQKSLDTWCRNFEKLPDSVKSRLTVENDDRKNLYSTKMLYDSVYKRLGVPIVFDSHHFELGPQDTSYSEAFFMARETWPDGIRQLCHHSNSKKRFEDETCRTYTAHSDYYYTPFDSCGVSVDVDLEAKAKELAVFDYLQHFSSKV